MYEIYKRYLMTRISLCSNGKGMPDSISPVFNWFFLLSYPLDHTIVFLIARFKAWITYAVAHTSLCELEFDANREPDAVYFDLLGAMLIEYPGTGPSLLRFLVSLTLYRVVYLG